MTEQDRDDTPQSGASEPPGAQLKRAREEAGWDLGQVAASLHLSRPVIEALERDDYDALPPPLFVRGYIRAYADIVGIDPAPLLAAYNAHGGGETDVPAGGPVASEPAGISARRIALAGAGLVVVLAAALGGAWWLAGPPSQPGTSAGSPSAAVPAGGGSADEGEESAGSDAPVQSEAGDARETSADRPAGEDLAEPELVGDEPGTAPAPSAGETADNGPAEATGDGPGAGGLGDDTGAGGTGDDVGAEDTGDDGAGEPTGAAAQESSGEVVTGSSAQQPPPIPPGEAVELAFRFEQDTWVEVRDARGVPLVRRLVRAGMTRRVVGQRPVNVHLGNAPGVVLEVDGEPFPVARHTGENDVARFVVPQPDARASGDDPQPDAQASDGDDSAEADAR